MEYNIGDILEFNSPGRYHYVVRVTKYPVGEKFQGKVLKVYTMKDKPEIVKKYTEGNIVGGLSKESFVKSSYVPDSVSIEQLFRSLDKLKL